MQNPLQLLGRCSSVGHVTSSCAVVSFPSASSPSKKLFSGESNVLLESTF